MNEEESDDAMKDPAVKRWLRWLVTLVGMALGTGAAALALRIWQLLAQGAGKPVPTPVMALTTYALLSVVSFFVSYWCAPRVIERFTAMMAHVERRLDDTPMSQVLMGALGLLIGLGIAALISSLYRFGEPTLLMAALSVVTYAAFGYLGVSISTRRWREFPLLGFGKRERQRDRQAPAPGGIPAKILDTSVIIDGRVFDICKTGFLEGTLTIPQFVLDELRHIADSSDAMRRSRGRRGLDVLQRIQKELDVPVHVDQTDFEDVVEVDVKLLRLAQQINGIVVTNDYNLNKVAAVTGVQVLNINELANAVKPVVMHGEEMTVQVVREGKEPGQGVAYLEDGTMIVVDNGRRYVGETVDVVVTTVLQTTAGRMIFTKLKSMDKVG